MNLDFYWFNFYTIILLDCRTEFDYGGKNKRSWSEKAFIFEKDINESVILSLRSSEWMDGTLNHAYTIV